jgi:hypothetical protein
MAACAKAASGCTSTIKAGEERTIKFKLSKFLDFYSIFQDIKLG